MPSPVADLNMISPQQARLLRYLADNRLGFIPRLRELSAAAGYSDPSFGTVRKAIRALIGRGYLAEPHGLRSLHLTEAGRRAANNPELIAGQWEGRPRGESEVRA